MKQFYCQCGQPVFFDSEQCLAGTGITEQDLLNPEQGRAFSLAQEFRFVPIRQLRDERANGLLVRVPGRIEHDHGFADDRQPGTVAALERGGVPRNEDAALAAEILVSLNESKYGYLGKEWEAEIQRRLDDFEAGRAELISSQEVFEEIEAALRAGRAPR